ncbi:MAG: CDGSH iron-sulfur domain-containing protein [Spirochaetaceae bacterium]|nr:CDGSH iron-sulfur domain-containing protein [Spirochaetaceae bacterium]
MNPEIYVKVTANGPYLVYGLTKLTQKIILTNEDGVSIGYGDGKMFEIKALPAHLCRCGQSRNAPFCDGSHLAAHFDGRETADTTPIMQQESADKLVGPKQILLDNQNYCAFARFCDRAGQIWRLVAAGREPELAANEANLCPSGRLVMYGKDGKSLEAKETAQLNLLEDTGLNISGPLWLRGSIKVIGADDIAYEVRAKQTLCRCGQSSNKPFCDGSHAGSRYKAHYPQL